jgi:DNA-binding transcriptional regulator YiaG
MTFKELRKLSGMTQKQFYEYFGIPRRTLENWEAGANKCPEYLLHLMEYKLKKENIIK